MSSGIWKNSEDEALKVAVMKYGLNKWSQISSIFRKKSAEQCKARWYEWLDPSIKKTEWTREEEEKLLHLAKIFPCQWRTIAPIVGRTAAQCMEHYEKLLNQAQGKEDMGENDPRRLRPGEIDPNPEAKPARPDPIDMDEDEKEMLAELRVRVSNFQGKKAKRIARTKMLEDARRLAGIQKKRELKAAGIEANIKKKIKGVNYNEEIPFKREPLKMGYHADESETPKPNLHIGNISLQTFEGKRRTEEEEARRRLDEKKMKKLRERDVPKAVETINKLKNHALAKNQTKLLLSAPQLQDKELEEMSKLNFDSNWDAVSQSNVFVVQQSAQIKSGLFSLPKPKNEYKIEIPELSSVEPELQKRRKIDAEDQEALGSKSLISQSVRKNIPEELGHRKEAEQLLADEILRMISRDAVPSEDVFNENDLDDAAKLLKDEMEAIQASLKHGNYSREDLQSAWNEVSKNLIHDNSLNKEERIAFAKNEFETKKDRLDQECLNLQELTKKVNLVLEYYPQHGQQIQATLTKHLQDIDRHLVEQKVLKQLQMQEQSACNFRLTELERFSEHLVGKEAELQRNHEKLKRQREEALKEAPLITFM